MEVPAVHDDPIAQVLDTSVARLAAYGYLLTGSQSAGDELVRNGIVRAFVRYRRRAEPRIAEARVRAAMRAIHLASVRRAAWRAQAAHVEGGLDPLAEVLGSLTPQQRAAIILRHVDQLTIQEIAAAMRVRESTVANWLSQALATVRETFGDIAPLVDRIDIVDMRRR
jgi:DNA-directed RNA polymerase specialized sigma24 family protein